MIPEGWETYKIGDFININPRISLKKGGDYSFIEMKDLDASRKYVVPSCKKNLTGGSKFCNGDTLFARITPCLENGKICQVRNLSDNIGFGSTEFMVLRGKEGISDSDFVYYLSRTEYMRNAAIQNMTGTSGRQRVETSAFAEIEFIAPSNIKMQSRIASILTSLDDKIELNLRMNKTLEAIAQAIFKEWFIDFRFPGFDGELVDGLPNGWRKGKLLELFQLQRGHDLPSVSRVGGNYPVVAASGISSYHNEFKVYGPGITTGRSGVIGNVYYISENYWPLNTSLFVKKFIQSTPLHAYFTLKSINLLNLNGGSAVPTLNRNDVHALDQIIPAKPIIDAFENIVSTLFAKIFQNNNENHILIQLRDTLLPKLMTGKIIVA